MFTMMKRIAANCHSPFVMKTIAAVALTPTARNTASSRFLAPA